MYNTLYMHEKEVVAEHMEIGNHFREGLRTHMDHEHLDRAEHVLNETLSKLPHGPVINKENYLSVRPLDFFQNIF